MMINKLITLFALTVALLLAAPAVYAQEAGKKDAGKAAEESVDMKEEKVVYSYDRGSRRDPFVPIIVDPDNRGRKTGVPPTPPERYDIAQIKLVAILKSGEDYKALVKLPDGKHYTILLGHLIGLNSGEVIEISKTDLVIEERLKDYRKKSYTNQVIMKLRQEEK